MAKGGQALEAPIITKGVNRAVQRVAKAAGLDPRGFSGHACRIGVPARTFWPPVSISAGSCWLGTGSGPGCRPTMDGNRRRISREWPHSPECNRATNSRVGLTLMKPIQTTFIARNIQYCEAPIFPQTIR